jgi:hypothetical protein
MRQISLGKNQSRCNRLRFQIILQLYNNNIIIIIIIIIIIRNGSQLATLTTLCRETILRGTEQMGGEWKVEPGGEGGRPIDSP